MSVLKKIKQIEEKPFRVICTSSDYSASFKTKDEARRAAIRHLDKFMEHDVKIVTSKTYSLQNF